MNTTNDSQHEQAVEAQPRDEKTTALSLVTPVSTRVGYATGAGVTAEVLFNVMNAGPSASFVIASLAAGAAWYFSPEIRGVLQRYLPFVKVPNVLGDVTWRDVLSGRESREDEQVDEEGDNESELGNTVDGTIEDRALDEDETAFVRNAPVSASSPSGVQRFTVEQFVSHTERNSYKAFIGRSLTQERNPALAINFYKRHIKIIGASQKGKSSMAAAFLDTVARTHDPEHVMVALLDMEDQTSKLFTDLPHLARMTLENNETVLLHARTPEQVLEYLSYIVDLMNYRYTLSKMDVAQEPLFIVYLEEFLALKDHFKLKIDQAIGKDKELAKRDYGQLVYYIKEIARRGLKVLVQFLMCAQVDYRDEDLQEALINVTSGICFCVRATAASAAGFMQTEFLNRNAKENRASQGVAEMPDCKDLILAPEYNLEKLLIAWEKMQPVQEQLQETGKKKASPIAPAGTDRPTEASVLIYRPATPIYTEGGNVNAKTPIYTPTDTSVNGSASGLEAQTQRGHLHLLVHEEGRDFERREGEEALVHVNVNEETRAMIKRLNEMKNELKLTHGAIAKAVKLNGRDYPIYKAVCKEMGIATEKEA